MNDFLVTLKKIDINFTKEQEDRIKEKITEILNYIPRIGVFGKTGVGKSSLCNALFGQEICKVSDIKACTREPQDVLLEFGKGKGITLLDVPGVGENQKRDLEYSELYQNLIPELDVILWVLKADDRAFSVDIDFYKNIVKPHIEEGKPFLLVLNQIDKIEPFREWDLENSLPSQKQTENIDIKISSVAKEFSVRRSSVVPVSAEEKFGLMGLIDEIIFSLPDEKKISLAKAVPKENLSSKAKKEAEVSFAKVFSSTVAGATSGAALGAKIAGPIGAKIGAVLGGIGGFFSSFW
ncbi:GTPase family protein [Vibrio metschnikovii]|uniref:GTPase family protein n=1 Tax=Vibrio metschnikovii TaxID=28172 RepID=UPI001C2FBCD0|nr:GTPase [Vibrio metschnikovii]